MKLWILTACLLFTACGNYLTSKQDFYSYTKSGDLWRVPLLEPYEIVSPTNMDLDDWGLMIKHHSIEGKDYFRSGDDFQMFTIQTIGILDSVIVLTNKEQHWPILGEQYASTLIIDLKNKQQFFYANEPHAAELKAKMQDLKIDNIKMFAWDTIKKNFLDTKQLPKEWH